MSAPDIVDSIWADLDVAPDATMGMKNRVRANLVYLAKAPGEVIKEGERATATWGRQT
jgi:hypothetical protein